MIEKLDRSKTICSLIHCQLENIHSPSLENSGEGYYISKDLGVYGLSTEGYVFFQISYQKGELLCAYESPPKSSTFWKFARNATYFSNYAQCDGLTRSRPGVSRKIQLTLNGKKFFHDEQTAIRNGPHPCSGFYIAYFIG